MKTQEYTDIWGNHINDLTRLCWNMSLEELREVQAIQRRLNEIVAIQVERLK